MNIKQAVALLQENGYEVKGTKIPDVKITRKVINRVKKLFKKHQRVVLVRRKTKITVFSFDGHSGRIAGGKKGSAKRWSTAKKQQSS